MARPISWQRDLAGIHRRVSDSPRSPYHREDIERLFDLRHRAAQELINLMPRIGMGNAIMVEREGLLEFLGGCLDAEDLAAHLQQLRKSPPRVGRRKMRLAIPREFEAGKILTLPSDVSLFYGELEMKFTTLEDFSAKLLQLIQVIDDPAFERKFCVRPPAPVPSPEEVAQAEDRRRVLAFNAAAEKIAAADQALQRRQLAIEDGLPDEADLMGGAADVLRAEALTALDAIDDDGLTQPLRAKIASLFPAASPSCRQTFSPGSMLPPVAEPSAHSELEDRFAS